MLEDPTATVMSASSSKKEIQPKLAFTTTAASTPGGVGNSSMGGVKVLSIRIWGFFQKLGEVTWEFTFSLRYAQATAYILERHTIIEWIDQTRGEYT
jgi:hypothetical protein